jgi:hypothetical protein
MPLRERSVRTRSPSDSRNGLRLLSASGVFASVCTDSSCDAMLNFQPLIRENPLISTTTKHALYCILTNTQNNASTRVYTAN